MQIHHLVEEQVLTVDVSQALAGPALLDRLGELHRRRLVPVLERVFDEFDRAGEVVRIDRLEVTLGTFAPDELHRAEDRFRAALRTALAGAMRRGAALQREGRALVSAFEQYLLHGAWPADRAVAARVTPAEMLGQLIAEDPLALVAMLRRRGSSETLLRRLVRQMDEGLLAALLHRLEPVHAAYVLGYLAEVRERHAAERLISATPAELAEMLWTIVLRDALHQSGLQANRKAFLRRLLVQLARSGGTTLAALVAQLRRGLPRTLARRRAPGSLVAVLSELIDEAPELLSGDTGLAELAELLGRDTLSGRARRRAKRLIDGATPGQVRWLILGWEGQARFSGARRNLENIATPKLMAALAALDGGRGALSASSTRIASGPAHAVELAREALATIGAAPSAAEIARVRALVAAALAAEPGAARHLLRDHAAADPARLCGLLGAPLDVAARLLAPHCAASLAALAAAGACTEAERLVLLGVAARARDGDVPDMLLAKAVATLARARGVPTDAVRRQMRAAADRLSREERGIVLALCRPPERALQRLGARHAALEQLAAVLGGGGLLGAGDRVAALVRLLPGLSGTAPDAVWARLAAGNTAEVLRLLRVMPTAALMRLALLLAVPKAGVRRLAAGELAEAIAGAVNGALGALPGGGIVARDTLGATPPPPRRAGAIPLPRNSALRVELARHGDAVSGIGDVRDPNSSLAPQAWGRWRAQRDGGGVAASDTPGAGPPPPRPSGAVPLPRNCVPREEFVRGRVGEGGDPDSSLAPRARGRWRAQRDGGGVAASDTPAAMPPPPAPSAAIPLPRSCGAREEFDAAALSRMSRRALLRVLASLVPAGSGTRAWVRRRLRGALDVEAEARWLVLALVEGDGPAAPRRRERVEPADVPYRMAALVRARPFAALRNVARRGLAPDGLRPLLERQRAPLLFAAMAPSARDEAARLAQLLTGRRGRLAVPPDKVAQALARAVAARDWRNCGGRGFAVEWLRQVTLLASLSEQKAVRRLLDTLPPERQIAPLRMPAEDARRPPPLLDRVRALLGLPAGAALGAVRKALGRAATRAQLARALSEAERVALLGLLAPNAAAGLLHIAERLAGARRACAAPLSRATQWECLLAAALGRDPVPALVGLVLDGSDAAPTLPPPLRGRVEAMLAASLEGMRDATLRVVLDLRKRERARRAAETRTEAGEDAPSLLYVGNAGLVLAGAFLPRLFGNLRYGATDEAGWRWEDGCQARAVHLLQWLVDGRGDAPEPQLALNKLLCGLVPAEPIVAGITLREDELRMGATLLRTMLASWPPLAESGVEALRETFFQREGRLTRTETGWRLEVETRVLDILLAQLPWGYSTMLLPWMAAPIAVQWR